MDNFSVTSVYLVIFSMPPSSLSAQSSGRPTDGYVTPRGILSPRSTPTKLHPRVDLNDLPTHAITSQTHLHVFIAQCFTDKDLLVYHSLLSCSQSLPVWVSIHNEISQKLSGKSLFPPLPNGKFDMDIEMTHDDFSAYYAPGLSQDSSLTLSMLHFFHYLHDRMDVKLVD